MSQVAGTVGTCCGGWACPRACACRRSGRLLPVTLHACRAIPPLERAPPSCSYMSVMSVMINLFFRGVCFDELRAPGPADDAAPGPGLCSAEAELSAASRPRHGEEAPAWHCSIACTTDLRQWGQTGPVPPGTRGVGWRPPRHGAAIIVPCLPPGQHGLSVGTRRGVDCYLSSAFAPRNSPQELGEIRHVVSLLFSFFCAKSLARKIES